ncbi:MAG: hypothetical protein K2X27_05040 [Candidatus Obscuribacterales bacterium]|nr:hypothetical protein [Candidatus Obscuribacterales bacterium]
MQVFMGIVIVVLLSSVLWMIHCFLSLLVGALFASAETKNDSASSLPSFVLAPLESSKVVKVLSAKMDVFEGTAFYNLKVQELRSGIGNEGKVSVFGYSARSFAILPFVSEGDSLNLSFGPSVFSGAPKLEKMEFAEPSLVL